MEALAAIALAGNILQFIEVGYKVLKTTKEIRASGQDASRFNQGLEYVTKEMKDFSQRIEHESRASGMTDDEKALLRLSSECQKCSEDLLELLESLKNRRPSSMLHSLRAAFRDTRKQDQKARLQLCLDNLRKQMDMQLSNLTRKETLAKLGSLDASAEAISLEIATTKKMVESIQKAIQSSDGKSGLHYHFQSVLQISNEALIKSRRSVILSGLRSDKMDQRFLEVAKAHSATFEWLLLDPKCEEESRLSTAVTEANSDVPDHKKELAENKWALSVIRESGDRFKYESILSFNNWLRSGSGIFHVAGKPGAGKSTLMKFLCQSPKTLEYLRDWCGDDKLVFAKVFFWRQGREDQRNLASLIRNILYQVLQACPELISVAFPVQWADTVTTGVGTRYEDGVVQDAFDRIFSNGTVFKGRKLVFFIDALDEYSGRPTELVEILVKWSRQHPANIKLCVASREWNEFLVNLSHCPRLRIHDCTRQDITRFVTDKFDGLCRHVTAFDAKNMAALANEIVSKAEGVFVWVRLVINAMEDGILNGDGIADLRIKVHAFPNELDDLYQYLFDSIPEGNRAQAFEALRLTHFLSSNHGKPLLRYWFLSEVIAAPDVAMNMVIVDRPLEREKLIESARRQIYGRCKGFLEVHASKIWDSPGDGEVKYMHSTVQEFLDKPRIKSIIDARVGHVDFFNRTCQTFLATLKYGCPDVYYDHQARGSFFSQELTHILWTFVGRELDNTHAVSTYHEPKNHWFRAFLDTLQTIVTKICTAKNVGGNVISMGLTSRSRRNMDDSFFFHRGTLVPADIFLQVFVIHNCIPWFLKQKDIRSLIQYLSTAENDLGQKRLDAVLLVSNHTFINQRKLVKYVWEARYQTAQLLFAGGLSPNLTSLEYDGPTLFEYYILTCIFRFSAPTVRYFDLLELCLQYGAKSQMFLRFGPMYHNGKRKERFIKAMFARPSCRDTLGVYVQLELPVVSFALRKKGILSLHDLFELWFPNDYVRLHRLLDQPNDPAVHDPALYPVSSSSIEIQDSLFGKWESGMDASELVEIRDPESQTI